MGMEIERKFVAVNAFWVPADEPTLIVQGYLSLDPQRVVRVRVADGHGYITIKGEGTLCRPEFEYEIPVLEAEELLQLCLRPLIEKLRYRTEYGRKTWEIDVFQGENEGLVLAEVELESESEEVDRPSWAVTEVTHNPRYANVNLVRNPYRRWSDRNEKVSCPGGTM